MTRRTAETRNGSRLRLAADIGGTFTDIAVFDDRTGNLSFGKALSTPHRLVEGINAGVVKAGSSYKSAGLFLHGSTIAINTILERTGAKTALLVTEGFRDIYEIGRINRPDAYNLFFRKHEPLVERALRFEVKERVLSDGEIETPLDDAEIDALGRMLERLGVEATAILFLNCFARHEHEARAKAILERNHPHMFVSASHELSEEYREFERCSTVAANAYIGPIVRRYVREIDDYIRSEGFSGSFLIVQSTGGLYQAEQAKRHCVHMLESGPAAGVIGTQALCRALGLKNAIAFDMGGTTAKAGVIHKGEALTSGAALIGGYERALPVQIAMMDIFEVGTGGGSIARVENGGLRVGPQSAGAAPGPACYGLGGKQPTVTDANLVLGRLAADRFLGGEMRLDVEAAERALTRLEDAPFAAIERVYRDLERQGRAAIAGAAVKPQRITLRRAADMRYVGQEHAVTVDLPLKLFERQDRRAIKRLFDAMHELRYGTSAPQEPAEVVSLRSTVTGIMRKPPQETIARGKRAPDRSAFTGRRRVYLDGKFRPTPTYARAALAAGNRISGPALIEEHAATTLLLRGDRLEVDARGHLMIEVGGDR